MRDLCLVNAYLNSRHYYADKKLKVRIGNVRKEGELMYKESLTLTTKQWAEALKKSRSHPTHWWLEDENGNIYDWWDEDWTGCEGGIVVEGANPNLLKEACEIEYIPFSREIQTQLFLHFLPILREDERKVLYAFNSGADGLVLHHPSGCSYAVPFVPPAQ